MTIVQAVKMATQMLREHNELNNWIVVLNRRKSAFGVCSYKQKEIQLSSLLISVTTEDSIKNTIIHEIAHALCPKQGHNRIWQRKCIELGGNGKRCGGSDNYKDGYEGREEFEKKTAKYTLTCTVCHKKSYKNRHSTRRSSSCGEHGTRYYDERYKLIVTQNY